MRWWLMSVPLVLLMSGCEEVEDVIFGDDGFFDQVIAPTVEQSFASSSPSSSTSGSSTRTSSSSSSHPYDYSKPVSSTRTSSSSSSHPYDYSKPTSTTKTSSSSSSHPYDYSKPASTTKTSSSSSSSSSGPTYKFEPVKTTPSLPDFGTESPGLEPRHYESVVHSSSSKSTGAGSTPNPDAVYRPSGSASDSPAASRDSVKRPSRVRRPSDSGATSSRSRAGTSASRPASSSADDQ